MGGQHRILRVSQVAERFGHSKPWFYARRRRFEQIGFPPKDQELRGWNEIAVDNWLAKRANTVTNSSIEQQALEAIHGTTNA